MAINNITIPIVGTPFPEPKPEATAESATEEVKVSRNIKTVDPINLFDIGQTLCSATDDHMYRKDRYYIEYRDDADKASVYIYVDIGKVTGAELVFSATASKGQAQGQSKKLKVMVNRPGKWVEYLVDNIYVEQIAARQTEIEDDEVDYSKPWLNDVMPQGAK